jgi:hypothetical protein
MQFIRPLVFMALKHNIQFKAKHIPGKSNVIADAISRQQWDTIRKAAPQADLHPQPILDQFQMMFSKVTSCDC